MLFTKLLLLHSILSLASAQPVHPSNTTVTTSPPTYLTVPALITHNNATQIQCWRLRRPFTPSTTEGMNGLAVSTIANTTSLTYVVAPPHSDGSVHNAPTPQLVHILSGVVHITLPQDPNSDLWVVGGRGGLIIAVDTTGLGHGSSYPSDMETVAIMAPFAGGRVPEHEVIGEGACLGEQTFV